MPKNRVRRLFGTILDLFSFSLRENGRACEPVSDPYRRPTMALQTNRTNSQTPSDQPTGAFDPILDAGLAAAFGPESTPGGWSHPPLLRDDSSEDAPLVHPSSPEMPRGSDSRYQLLGEIARGGMGVILKGRDPDLGRDLAFKVLKADLAGKPAAEQRFIEEAQVGGQLQHPGVVPVYDLGRFADGRPYFAMKLVKGRTLAEMLTERPDPSSERGELLHTFLKVCDTMAYAHSRGVIHRDLKPANIMVGGFGEVLVMDWGLAKVLPRGGVADEERATQASREREQPRPEPTVIHTARSGSGSDTVAGSVMGTPAFMSREQAGGEIDKLDERADVFGLGAVLCVILTGQPPYVADTAEATRLKAIRGELDDTFGRIDGCGTDPELVALCKRCLSPRRDDRPRHAGEVAAAMTAHLAEVEQRAQRSEVARAAAAAEAKEQRKRRRVQLALAAVVTACLAAGGATAWWADRQRHARADEEARRQAAADRDVNAAVYEMTAALDQTPTLASDPPSWDAALAVAESAGRRADGLLTVGHPTDAVREQVQQAHDRLTDAQRDRRFVARLEGIRMHFGEQFDPATTAREYVAAFRDYGLDPGVVPSSEMGRILRDHTYGEQLSAAAAALLNHAQDPVGRMYWNAVLDVVFPADTFYGKWRTADRSADRQSILQLAEQADVKRLTPTTIWLMSLNLCFRQPSEPTAAARLLRAGLAQYPADFWLNYELCTVVLRKLTPPRYEEAILHGTAAVTLRPSIARAHHELAFAQYRLGDLVRAEAEYREAIRLDPTFAWSHYDLGLLLSKIGDLEGALTNAREAVRLGPTEWATHWLLGFLLAAKGDKSGALEEYREVARVDSQKAQPHITLAHGLRDIGDLDEAIAELREARRLVPKSANALNDLVRLERMQSAVAKLESARKGEKFTDPSDLIHVALLAALPCNRNYALAVSLFTDAFAKLKSPDRLLLNRYDAACAAVRCARGDDRGGPVGKNEQLALLKKARDWLTAELAPHRHLSWSGTSRGREMLAERYDYWQRDPDLASVRYAPLRESLPKEEQQAWEKFWTEVEVVRRLSVMTLPDSSPPR
jgi:eukaryotic-like serine/threonine-protein kinase